MDSKELIQLINQEPEMNPDSHDGSYELMRNIVSSYATISDYSLIDYKDLNAVYAMAIGTWKLNAEKKKDYINAGHLSRYEKERMANVINDVWDKACRGKYTNREGKGPSVGMFGTGFYSFVNKTDSESCQRFIRMMVDISNMTDDYDMYNRCEKVFDEAFRGMQAAAASVMLHCLKPLTFPILNSNFGDGTVFDSLGIALNKPGKLVTYIDNCRKIKDFRDSNLTIKNYRILDQLPRKYDISNGKTFNPPIDEYDPGFSQEQWFDIVTNTEFIGPIWGRILAMFYLEKDGTSCTALSKKYGDDPSGISGCISQMCMNLQKKTQCPIYTGDNSNKYWLIMFQYRPTVKGESGSNIWRLRPELYDALSETDIMKYLDNTTKNQIEMPLNTILYGPPGTGKTYNTVVYAVSIIEEKDFDEIANEATSDYKSVKARYDEYVSEGRIAFTTFHQSYGYEDFIEGIKPIMNDGEDDIGYRIEPGVFKAFCERASVPSSKQTDNYGIRKDPAIWKVSLGGTHDNPVRTDCMENNHIRIGWDDYGPEIADSLDEIGSGKRVLNAFYNVMSIGDVVLSCYTSSEIDAIGVITGDCEWDDSYGHYKRIRRVKWLVKNIRENIVEINNGAQMTLATVYWIGIPLKDILNIVEKYKPQGDKKASINDEKYVFIIDEINRGNISKVFGELITLIEETKRIGASEAMTVELPYSHSRFGVPNNVFILGTMNTADRSIAIMDTALRRRFSFVEMLPDSDVLRSIGADKVEANGITLNVADMLDVINERIAFLYDREHTIGHAFFTSLKDDPSVDNLGKIFEKSIIPLLQEYFYEDYSKIQLVLGDDGKTGDNKQYQFIRDEEVEAHKIFASAVELESTMKYTIQYSAFDKIQSYKMISKNL